MKKTCRYCKYFKYHLFAGFCCKKACDTYDCFGNCKGCESFAEQNEEEKKDIDDYEKNVLIPYLEKIKH